MTTPWSVDLVSQAPVFLMADRLRCQLWFQHHLQISGTCVNISSQTQIHRMFLPGNQGHDAPASLIVDHQLRH